MTGQGSGYPGGPPPYPGPTGDNRVYLSARNRWYLALKVFGYNLLGYLLILAVLVVMGLIIGLISLIVGR